jgi:hypothetical protein
VVERFYQRLKDAPRARLAGPTWTAHLPWVLLGLRAAPRKEDNISPTQAVFGTPIVLPGQFLDASANVNEPEFVMKFSNELGAAESVATRHNSARARDVPDELPADLVCPCTPGPLPGAEALHTDRAAATRPVSAGQVRPVASSGGAMWRQDEKYERAEEAMRSRQHLPPIRTEERASGPIATLARR